MNKSVHLLKWFDGMITEPLIPILSFLSEINLSGGEIL
jgi:hypothetical protein